MLKLFFFTLLFIISSCGKFIYSPYEVSVKNMNLNGVNKNKILEDSASYPPTYKISLLSDTHHHYVELKELVKRINSRDSKFVIITGDMSNIGLQSELLETKKHLSKLKIPFITTAGNHDLLTNGAYVYERMFGKTDYSLIIRNLKIILYNSNNWESLNLAPNIPWIKSELQDTSVDLKILATHVSPADTDRFTPEEISDFSNLVKDNGVNIIVRGHDHNPGVGTFGGVPNLVIGSSLKRSYYELTITPTEITYEKIDL